MEINKVHEIIMPLAETLCKRLSERLEKAAKEGTKINLYWIEQTVWVLVMALAGELMSLLIRLVYERGYVGWRIECRRCLDQMVFQRYRQRPVISSFGLCRYERAYYYCRSCGKSHVPLDEKLEAGARQISPRLQRVIGYLAGYLSFEPVANVLEESYGLEISDEAIREVAEEIGQEAIAWEDRQKQRYLELSEKLAPPRAEPKTWIIEADGKKVGFQDGSWQEVKVGVIYELSDRVEVTTGRHELLKREIVAKRGHWQTFAEYFGAAMQRVGIREGDRIVAIGDGGNNIEPIFEWVAPEAKRIRDFYHVAEYVHAIGEVRFGAATAQAQQWSCVQLHKLKASDIDSVVRSIRHLKLTTDEAEQTRANVLGYFANHRHAMDYAQYQTDGLPLGSGAVEGGCRLIGARTNGCGRRWGNDGGHQIVALRVIVLNDNMDAIRPRPAVEKVAA